MTDILLEGCTSRPLAAYLKALGILRLVGEQCDAQACGAWRNRCFVLSSSLDKQDLCYFFLHDWRPTPLVSPWNSGSGFYPKKEVNETNGVDLLLQSNDPRLREYRAVISKIQNWLKNQSQEKWKDALKEHKTAILQHCRSELPEACLPWLDAVFIIGEGKPKAAPLLRTGGNEGNMEYANHFMQHVSTVLSPPEENSAAHWLESSLFAVTTDRIRCKAAGQFNPGGTGGINQGRGFAAELAPVNPWDFILMLEGTLLFAGTLSRRSPAGSAKASFPFCVENFAAGFVSSGVDTKVAGELWLPLWSRPASLREVRRLLGEGRAVLGRRQAANGLDFARAITSLGVERGIDHFERYSFLERRGQSYVALPSGTLSVRYRPKTSLLEPVAHWLEKSRLKKEEPATLTSARRSLAAALFSCTRTPDAHHFQSVSRALARMDVLLQQVASRTLDRRDDLELTDDWISACDDGIPEVRIAAALASLGSSGKLWPLRAQIAPVHWRGPALEGIGNLFLHRLLLAQRYGVSPLDASVHLHPADLLPLLQGKLDMALLQDLLLAFSLVRKPQSIWKQPLQSRRLPYALAMLKLLYTTPLPRDCGLDTECLHPELRIARLVQAQRLEEACMLAAQRVRIARGGELYLPPSFAESVRGLSPASVLACLAVPVAPRALLRCLYQRPAERSYHVAG